MRGRARRAFGATSLLPVRRIRSIFPRTFPRVGDFVLVHMALALQNLPVLALPSLNILAVLLGVYIVFVGPVNYLVLRRLKKLDWGWVTIPF